MGFFDWFRRKTAPASSNMGEFVDLMFADQGLEAVINPAAAPGIPGAVELRSGRFEEAEAAATAACRDNSGNPWPWFVMAGARAKLGRRDAAREALHAILGLPDLEARVRLWSWNGLRELGEQPSEAEARRVLGLVFEMPMQGGLSMLAAYADGTARYRNYSGHLIVYEAGGALGEQVKDLISTCEQFPLPSAGDRTLAVLGPARLSFLTPAGIKLYERGLEPKDTGPYDALLTKASALMVALLELRKQG